MSIPQPTPYDAEIERIQTELTQHPVNSLRYGDALNALISVKDERHGYLVAIEDTRVRYQALVTAAEAALEEYDDTLDSMDSGGTAGRVSSANMEPLRDALAAVREQGAVSWGEKGEQA